MNQGPSKEPLFAPGWYGLDVSVDELRLEVMNLYKLVAELRELLRLAAEADDD